MVHLLFQRLLIAFHLTVSLRMVGCSQDMRDTHQMKVVPKSLGDVTSAIIREEFGTIFNRKLIVIVILSGFTRFVYSIYFTRNGSPPFSFHSNYKP